MRSTSSVRRSSSCERDLQGQRRDGFDQKVADGVVEGPTDNVLANQLCAVDALPLAKVLRATVTTSIPALMRRIAAEWRMTWGDTRFSAGAGHELAAMVATWRCVARGRHGRAGYPVG